MPDILTRRILFRANFVGELLKITKDILEEGLIFYIDICVCDL
jgi:hypothetical protein